MPAYVFIVTDYDSTTRNPIVNVYRNLDSAMADYEELLYANQEYLIEEENRNDNDYIVKQFTCKAPLYDSKRTISVYKYNIQ